MSNPLQWWTERNAKKRAWALAAPVLKAIDEGLAAFRSQGDESPYLRNERSHIIKDLQNRAQRIRYVADKVAAASDLPRLENVINTGLQEVERGRELHENQQKLYQRIQHADSEVKSFLPLAQGAPIAVAQKHRNIVNGIKNLRNELAYEKRQAEFYRLLKNIESEVKNHRGWLENMQSSAAELKAAREQLEALRTSSAWSTNQAAEESLTIAEHNLKAAEVAREGANWQRARNQVRDAIVHIQAARIACDRTLSQAQEEIAMWRKFAPQSPDYSQMRATLQSFPENIGQAELVRWVQFRSEIESQIDRSAAEVMRLFRQLPLKVSPVPDWKERDLDLHRKFANAVKDATEQVTSLLRQRHQKRRRSRTTRSWQAPG